MGLGVGVCAGRIDRSGRTCGAKRVELGSGQWRWGGISGMAMDLESNWSISWNMLELGEEKQKKWYGAGVEGPEVVSVVYSALGYR